VALALSCAGGTGALRSGAGSARKAGASPVIGAGRRRFRRGSTGASGPVPLRYHAGVPACRLGNLAARA